MGPGDVEMRDYYHSIGVCSLLFVPGTFLTIHYSRLFADAGSSRSQLESFWPKSGPYASSIRRGKLSYYMVNKLMDLTNQAHHISL